MMNVSGNDGTLLNALQEDEKKFLRQNEEIQTVNILQQTERNQKIAAAEKMARDSGLKKDWTRRFWPKRFKTRASVKT